ncbi:MAG: FGGY family carbohydrate kinase [Anaerolineae bacterium]|jgi:sedoheptulokinase
MACTIGLDLGTTTVTAVLWDVAQGRVRHQAQRRNDAAINPLQPTRAEQDPQRLRALALEVLAALIAGSPDNVDVLGIGLTGQMHGLLGVDGENRPLTPFISWQDRRTAERDGAGATPLERLQARLGDLPWQENGCTIAHGYGAAIWYWLVDQQQMPAGVERLCPLTGWLAGQLTGQPAVSDPTLAASWGLYSQVQAAWSTDYVRRLGLDARRLPPIRPAGERLGGLDAEVARRVGLPPGTPVHNGLGDNQAAFLGACLPFWVPDPALVGVGAYREALDAIIVLNLGTGGQVCWLAPRFEPPTETVETRPLFRGLYLRVGASLCGGAAYAWLMNTVRSWLVEFGQEVEEEAVYRRLNALAAEEGTAGLRVHPTFLGKRGDPGVRTGRIEGITLDNLRLGPLARATLVGMVDELRDLYRAEGRSADQGHERLVATGGAVYKNPILLDVIAGRFGCPAKSPPWRETAAVGASALAASTHCVAAL